MRELHAKVASGEEPETWIVVEHDPVVTIGRNAKAEHLLVPRDVLSAKGIDVVDVERGGDVTYHGPGQLVVYPIMKLERFREIVPLVTAIEEGVLTALLSFGIEAHQRREHRGIYVGERSICAIGLAIRKMTSMHGLALNVATPLDYDRLIVPCGMPQLGITSLSAELARPVALEEAKSPLLSALAARLGRSLVTELMQPARY